MPWDTIGSAYVSCFCPMQPEIGPSVHLDPLLLLPFLGLLFILVHA